MQPQGMSTTIVTTMTHRTTSTHIARLHVIDKRQGDLRSCNHCRALRFRCWPGYPPKNDSWDGDVARREAISLPLNSRDVGKSRWKLTKRLHQITGAWKTLRESPNSSALYRVEDVGAGRQLFDGQA
jgi:hypothetical protein